MKQKIRTNVDLILEEGIRQCVRIPREVRKQLNEAVGKGILAHLPKTKFAKEIYCRPELLKEAEERQKVETEKTIANLKIIMA